jgi:phosphoglycolate phosphatase
MSIKEDNLIFDLDGTLFDSAPEILDCLKKVFIANNLKINNVEMNESIIGPPLEEIFKKLILRKDQWIIGKIKRDFIKLYDSDYCYRTKLYKGVRRTLETLKIKKNLILITNKRFLPTEKMLKNSKIDKLFDFYLSVDPKDEQKKTKSILIGKTINDLNINPKDTVYIGDTESDLRASQDHNIKFIYAGWGYGNYVDEADAHLNSIEELI